MPPFSAPIHRRSFLLFAASFFSHGHSVAQWLHEENFSSIIPALVPATIAIVGDTQRTSSVEQLLLGREQNDKERVLVAQAIASAQPHSILHLGDVVCYGEDIKDWAYFENVFAPVRAGKPLMYAAPGNHDYGLIRRSEQYLQRLAQHCNNPRTTFPQMVALGSYTCILVDSNFDMMSKQAIARQDAEYARLMAEAEQNTATDAIIVMAHHPPYSNSDLGGNAKVQQHFLPLFEQARKTKLFLSGHVHSYERFFLNGKHYVVSGGGGGPRRTIRTEPSRPFHFDMYRDGVLRPFHFLLLHTTTNDKTIQVMMLNHTQGTFYVGDSFSIL